MGCEPLLVLLAALLLPLLTCVLITVSVSYRNDQRATEVAGLVRARAIGDAVGARLQVVGQAMRILATIRSIHAQDWREAKSRSTEIAAQQGRRQRSTCRSLSAQWRAGRSESGRCCGC